MFSKKLIGTLGAGIFALGIAASAAPAQAATFTVNTTNNNGGGSLRSQINAANLTAAKDQILFDIPGEQPAHDLARHRPAGRHAAGGDPRLLAAGLLAGERGIRRS